MSAEHALQEHLELCDEVFALVREENAHLREKRRAPQEALIERKRGASARLGESLERLKGLNKRGLRLRTGHLRELHRQCQQRTMKIVMLDRENEQLLLKYSMGAQLPRVSQRPAAGKIRGIYGFEG